eukprot:TRINITY_DN6263_c0_g2_i1.p1 TRINITY_DN6263_c0_g2~~TRINITY_DN6263_c0_g2_i1.p1  ORF type:complete len:126 (+),score=18.83 TRINITY_DN6263_c0_g2_i1:861-1238(+)
MLLVKKKAMLQKTLKVMRYAWLANMTGHPSIAFPVGYDEETNCPIGLQVTGKYWDEETILRLACIAESFVHRRKPRKFLFVTSKQRPVKQDSYYRYFHLVKMARCSCNKRKVLGRSSETAKAHEG